ncbi:MULTISPECIES: restriction endonuclease subunit S [Streptomyces]|uniref:restriction endonuclease subunit S n=1 Tax=Streptomyces TaxID=1883 RepID=UPI00099D9607|nr:MULTISPECIES: restriction endonuclease subunit S [Streptomyces]MCL7369110.1 restriction endonuclease subunit S [Streptomyces ardesiacus]NEB64794.1 N-6 DNA methylase [Streptomyces diastaticus]
MSGETAESVEERGPAPDRPGDWGRVRLGDICDVQGGGPAVRAAEQVPEGVPLVRPADLRHQRISAGPAMTFVDPERARGWGKYRLLADDILVTRTGTVGRVALVTGRESGWLYNTHLFRVRVKDPLRAPYLLARLSHHSSRDWLERRAAGTTGMRSITLRTLQDLPVPVPTADRQKEIGAALRAVDEKIRAHEEVVRATADLRETLADLLLSDRLPLSPPRP